MDLACNQMWYVVWKALPHVLQGLAFVLAKIEPLGLRRRISLLRITRSATALLLRNPLGNYLIRTTQFLLIFITGSVNRSEISFSIWGWDTKSTLP